MSKFNYINVLKIGSVVLLFFSIIIFLSACGCECECIKGLDCYLVSVKLVSNDSLILEKSYCQAYDPFDKDKIIQDSLSQLILRYPAPDYAIQSKDTSYILDKTHTRDCTSEPYGYTCECAK